MKNEKGITLIALIITIIVMLILIGVTINVALNGGLFNTATDAKQKTQRESDREQLISAVVATVDNSGNFDLEKLVLPQGFQKTPEGRYKNTENNKEYTIDSVTGKVQEYIETNSGNGGSGAGAQSTYLDYTAETLPKFTFNTNTSDLADLLDPIKNTALTSIVSGEMQGSAWGSRCTNSFSATDDSSYYIEVVYCSNGETVEEEDVVTNYYIEIYTQTLSGQGYYYYSAISMHLPRGGNINGGTWYYLADGEEQASVVSSCPTFEGGSISDTASAAYYPKLFVVVED
ncbi:MAG: hypothetical protein J5507_06740 [Clostridia bacterium]|nr:hypothetical protein [Clostridia bacterium]